MSKGPQLNSPLAFSATIPPLMSAIQIDGSGGARIKIDVPESDIEAVTRLMALRGQELIITVALAPRRSSSDLG